ncbi:MAG: NAD(P)-dependent oxidoreductase, partial [Arthrobacter sp.]|nr:NAD(P)-dependent oxidoreductase [Arthrobacter sp.]
MHVAMIGLGEAGTLYAKGLLGLGWTVAGFDPAPVPTPEGVERKTSAQEVVENAEVVLCLVGGRAAVPAATSVAEYLGERTLFIDMNSAAPEIKTTVAAVVGEARYADVAVTGSVPEHGAATSVVVSGAASTPAAEVFAALGAPVEDIGGLPGDAARRKLLRSSFMKGLGALIVETLDAGEAMGARDWALEQLVAEHAGGVAGIERLYSGTLKHAERRGHEAEEAAAMLDGLGVRSVMSHAAAASHLLAAVGSASDRAELAEAYARIPV